VTGGGSDALLLESESDGLGLEGLPEGAGGTDTVVLDMGELGGFALEDVEDGTTTCNAPEDEIADGLTDEDNEEGELPLSTKISF
jgi:hypothetical protein